MADGSSELSIQRESPSEATPTMQTIPVPAQDYNQDGSLQQGKPQDNDGMNSLDDPYSIGQSFNPLASNTFYSDSAHAMIPNYDSLMMGPPGAEGLYGSFGNQLASDGMNPFSTLSQHVPSRASGSAGASYLDVNFNPSFVNSDHSISLQNATDDQRIKRRKTETDLRSRSKSNDAGISHQFTLSQAPFPVELQNTWSENQSNIRLNAAQQSRLQAINQPTLTNAVSALLMNEYSRPENSVSFEGGSGDAFNGLERTMKMFLEACDQCPTMLNASSGVKPWKDEIAPSQDVMMKSVGFFLYDYLREFSFA